MFPTLRAKLTVAFVLVTFMTVFLSGVGMVFMLREREENAARERVGRFSNAVQEQVLIRAGSGWKADALAAFLQQRSEELDLRFLLIDSKGMVIHDTSGKLTDQQADDALRDTDGLSPGGMSGFSFRAWQEGPSRLVVFHPSVPPVRERQFFVQDFQVRIVVPEEDLDRAWEGLLPRLLLSGGLALGAAVGVAYVLSRSITRPVVVVTRASEEMARGRYDQRIPVQGRDEIARLARSFNEMAHQVAHSHQMMRDLNANVAHELRTPLTSIQGYSQALLDGAVRTPEEAEHAARVINEEAERMRRLVDDLLYLSRLESGQLQIERGPVSVPALLQSAAQRVSLHIRDSGRELRVQTAIDIPIISGDEHRLEQVLANLLDNAMRHTPPGGRITVSARWSLDRVTITVHNTGSYISPEHLSRVFERFYQVDASRARDGRPRTGGLGLAIVKEIVAAHGGTITATSDPEAGTEFTVVLPIDSSRAAESGAWMSPVAASSQPGRTTGPRGVSA